MQTQLQFVCEWKVQISLAWPPLLGQGEREILGLALMQNGSEVQSGRMAAGEKAGSFGRAYDSWRSFRWLVREGWGAGDGETTLCGQLLILNTNEN